MASEVVKHQEFVRKHDDFIVTGHPSDPVNRFAGEEAQAIGKGEIGPFDQEGLRVIEQAEDPVVSLIAMTGHG